MTALIRAAQDANLEMQARLSEAEMRNAVTGRAVDTAKERVDRLSAKQRAALAQLSDARRVFEDRVRWAYTRGPTASLEGFLQSSNATQLLDRRALVEVVLEGDSDSVSRYLALRDSVDGAVSTADDILSQAEHDHASTQIAEDAAHGDAALTTLTVGLWQRAQRGLRDIVFPVVGPHAFGSDFGAPRMVGTPDQHTHEGNDIAAPLGAQLVSVEPGMVVAMGTDRLGGIKLWLAGRSGTYYYYAHLSKFADDVHEGDIVPAGTVVGYVGNTGNAAGGIPHLHFEIHPNGGPAVDPYQYLAAADRQQEDREVAVKSGSSGYHRSALSNRAGSTSAVAPHKISSGRNARAGLRRRRGRACGRAPATGHQPPRDSASRVCERVVGRREISGGRSRADAPRPA